MKFSKTDEMGSYAISIDSSYSLINGIYFESNELSIKRYDDLLRNNSLSETRFCNRSIRAILVPGYRME